MDEAARGQSVSDFYKGLMSGAPTEMTSLTEIKARLAAIELGQDNLWAKLDSVMNTITECDAKNAEELERRLAKKLDCLQGKELLSQFKANGHKPKRRKR